MNRVSAARLFEFSLVLNVEISYFYEGIKPPPKKPTGMQESMNVRDFMDFVSSHEGIALNRNFVRIRNKRYVKASLT